MDDLTEEWPAFMLEDPLGDLYYADVTEACPEFALLAWYDDEPDQLVARAFSVPFAFGPEVSRPELPSGGWDAVVRWAWLDRLRDRPTSHVSALEITVRRPFRGRGVSAAMVTAMRDNAARLGYRDLVAPVRPTGKSARPGEPMAVYAARVRPDGLPEDPWLRVHARAGGRVVRVCPRSMVVPGTLAEWRGWTGLPFDTTGAVNVPGALVPVHCVVEHDYAVYVEPNVWVHHRLNARS